MKELLGQYYGLDWVAMIASFLFMYFIGNKKRYGFIFGLIASIAWIFPNLIAHIWPGVFLNTVLIALHLRGYVKWGQSSDAHQKKV